MDNLKEKIIAALEKKACTKQAIYRYTLEVFNEMKEQAEELVGELAEKFNSIDEHVKIEYTNVNEFEFHVKFSGDLLIFTMHTNVTTFQHEHIIFKSPYIQEDSQRAYFGQVMVYNFMADSLRYNRLTDPGYLLARMMINQDRHFYIEGVRQLEILYPDISQNNIGDEILKQFIENAMITAIDQDLYAPNFQKIKVISLAHKVKNQMIAGGNKVGFQMNFDQD